MTKLATLCLLLAGCVESRIETSETDQEVLVGNGVSLNGVSLNGVSLNGVSLNGVSLNGVSLNGVSLDGVSLDGVSLNGVSLDGISADGTELTLASVGAQLVATLSNGDTIELRIDGATQLTGANSDLWSYAVSYATTLGWQPLCEGDALAVSGTWNTESGVAGGGAYTPSMTSFTFACRGKTIAKCVELGYKTPDLTDELTSCVRLLRGDYCGNGTPYTVDGTTLNLYDNRGVQSDTETWLTEGEWTPDGVRCITKDRFARFEQAADTIPSCVSKRVTSSCGNFRNGAVLVSELPVLEQANRESGSTMTLLSRK